MSITKEEFYNYSGYNSTTVNDLAVDFFLTSFQESLEKKLKYQFSLATVLETDKFNYFSENSNGEDFILINAWQEDNLTFKISGVENKEVDTLSESPLDASEYQVFRVLTQYSKLPTSVIPRPNPVVAIKLKEKLLPNQFLRVYGTWGYSEGMPASLRFLIYTALKNAIEYNESTTKSLLSGGSGAGGGAVQSVKTYTTSVMFISNLEAQDSAKAYFLNFLDTPYSHLVLKQYTNYFEKMIYNF